MVWCVGYKLIMLVDNALDKADLKQDNKVIVAFEGKLFSRYTDLEG